MSKIQILRFTGVTLRMTIENLFVMLSGAKLNVDTFFGFSQSSIMTI
ncbi:MAG: hypothetical protein N2235_05250 [Fischerella sp.]|nr:hypothetical protein [Fischerella sp.]